MNLPRVDAHQHFWVLERGDYGWLTEDLGSLYRDHLPAQLLPHLEATDVAATVLVQAAPTSEETEFLLDLAARTDFVAGVVGWVNMESADASEQLKRLAAHEKFKGVRPMIQDIDDDAWMLRSDLAPAFEALQRLGLRFDALVFPRHLRHLLTLLRRHPDLACVIDHGAKPNIAGGQWQPWAEDLAAIGEETSACCKLSGLLGEAGERRDDASLRPFAEHVLRVFGTTRVMWGSDWPVLNLAGDYESWCAMAERFVAQWDGTARDAVFGGNASRFYGLTGAVRA